MEGEQADRDFGTAGGVGFISGLWNGMDPPQQAGISFRCGGDTWEGNNLPNYVTLGLPDSGELADRTLNPETLSEIFQCALSAGSPIWGAVSHWGSHRYDAARANHWQPNEQPPDVGWLTVLPVKKTDVPDLPAPSRAIPLGRFATLIIAGEQPLWPDNPDHCQILVDLRLKLTEARMLKPVRYLRSLLDPGLQHYTYAATASWALRPFLEHARELWEPSPIGYFRPAVENSSAGR